MHEPLLPIPDAGRLLGHTGKSSGKSTIYKHCKEGRLTKVKIGGRSFVTRESAERLIKACEVVHDLDSHSDVATEVK